MIDFEKLKAHFSPEKISWRIGSVSKNKDKGLAFAYIDARDVMDRLDDVCGPENWSNIYPHAGSKTVCDIAINVNKTPDLPLDRWVRKADGAGDSDIEAEKGALSDGFKRAAVRWGIGRYLYDIKAPWVKIDEFKHIMPLELERLASLLPNATPGGVKVGGLSGIQKKAAGFWGQPSLFLAVPKKYEGKDDALKSWRIETFQSGVDKAPDRDLLAKFQTDNAEWLDKLDADTTFKLYEACRIRAEQFDHTNGA